MKRMILTLLAGFFITLLVQPPAFADTTYAMRVDGLACPYCAYGIEKKLKQIQGVDAESIDIDLKSGVVRVTTADGVQLTEERMKRLFNDAGFTFRGMEVSQSGS